MADVNNIDQKILNEILPKVGEGSKVCTGVMVPGDNGLVSTYTVCGKVHFEVVNVVHSSYGPIPVMGSYHIAAPEEQPYPKPVTFNNEGEFYDIKVEKRISTLNIYTFSLNRIAKVVCKSPDGPYDKITIYTLLGFLKPVDKVSSDGISKLEKSEIPKYMLSKILENKKFVVKKEGNKLNIKLDDKSYNIDLDSGKLYTIAPTEKLKLNSYYVVIDKNKGIVVLHTMSLTDPNKAYKYVVRLNLSEDSSSSKPLIEYAKTLIKKFLLKYGYELGDVIYTDFRVVKRIPVFVKYAPEYLPNYDGTIAHYVDKLEIVSKSNLFNPSWYYFTPSDRYFYFIINYNGNSYLVRYPASTNIKYYLKPLPEPEQHPLPHPIHAEEPEENHQNQEGGESGKTNRNYWEGNEKPSSGNFHEGRHGNKENMKKEETQRQEEEKKNMVNEGKEYNKESKKIGEPHKHKSESTTNEESLVEIRVKTSWPFGVWVMIPELSFIRLFNNNYSESIKMITGKTYKIYTKKRFTLLYKKHYYTAGTKDIIKGLLYKVYINAK